ncbi:hypothetical protein PNH38_12970 [Anoxybacillus rupiensis]|uniref:Uncharacterized protein n=1 Tax=Anoxybacteroides rupiense TaxID=311460 RepID=A0ABT5W9J9_9BACL|nr:hypothetical protein [Anoxybacillus rupiensis]
MMHCPKCTDSLQRMFRRKPVARLFSLSVLVGLAQVQPDLGGVR